MKQSIRSSEMDQGDVVKEGVSNMSLVLDQVQSNPVNPNINYQVETEILEILSK